MKGTSGVEVVLRRAPEHPGAFFRSVLTKRRIAVRPLALHVGLSRAHLGKIIKGERRLTAPVAIRLEQALGLSAELLMLMQVDWDIRCARKKHKKLIEPFGDWRDELREKRRGIKKPK